MFRSMTQIGGLLLLLRNEGRLARTNKRASMAETFVGVEQGAGGAQLQLIGRGLLMLIFFFQGARHFNSHGFSIVGLVGFTAMLVLCALVMVGFKARWSAVMLTAALGISNMWMYPFWTVRGAGRGGEGSPESSPECKPRPRRCNLACGTFTSTISSTRSPSWAACSSWSPLALAGCLLTTARRRASEWGNPSVDAHPCEPQVGLNLHLGCPRVGQLVSLIHT